MTSASLPLVTAAPATARAPLAGAEVIGAGLCVPVTGGGELAFANLDIAATAPCLVAVKDAIDDLRPRCTTA